MKTLMKLFLAMLIIGTFSCTKPKSKALGPSHRSDNPFPCKYENDLFSINMPQDWEYDDSEWCGLDSMRNFFDIYDPHKDIVRLHIVKTFIPVQWKDIGEATEMAIFARELAGEETELIARVDSVEIGGYPASILFFANYVGEDTIIQKQFVSYLQDSHIVVYVNEIYRPQFSQTAQLIGDKMIETLKYKKVSNPLDDDSVFVQASIDGLINHPVDERYIENARRLFEEANSED